MMKFLRIAQFLCVFQAALFGVSSSFSVPDKHRPAVSLVGGLEDIESRFSSVLVFSKDDKKLSSRCSGTKIANDKFITSAHCFIWEENGKIISWPSKQSKKKIYFSFDRKIEKETQLKTAEVKAIFFHPVLSSCLGENKNVISQCIDSAPDLAVVEITNSPYFKLAPISFIDFTGVNVGEDVTIVGFGFEKENDENSPKRKFHVSRVVSQEALKKVYLENPEEETKVDDELYFGAFGNALGEQYANLGSGDSGGPAFITRNKVHRLVGVNSFTFCLQNNINCEVATNSFFGRLHRGGKYFLGDWLSKVLTTKPSE